MTSTMAWAVFAGLSLGFGLWSLVSLAPKLNRPRLIHRVAPYLVDVSAGARELLSRRAVDPLPVLGTLIAPVTIRLRGILGSVLGGSDQITTRLRQAGSPLTVESFRSRQLLFGALGAAAGAVVGYAASRAQEVPFALQVGIVLIGAVGGVFLRDWWLGRQALARVTRMTEELPTVLEFLTLSLSAGEGIFDAVRRVSLISRGELARELAGTVADVGAGLPFSTSLQRLADDLRMPPLSRAVEQVIGALERGTPLAEVLRAQAQDARDEAKRSLLESAGKKEVAMLVPLVFLILPVTIVFAIFPGVFVLQLGF